MNTPVVSIIIPVYNVETYLRQCLTSLINQTLRNIEIICVDDGSTDGSHAILQEYAAQDERIHIITQNNAGLSIARNAGMKVVQAPYVMFCDSDDWYEPNMCEVMYHSIDGFDEAAFSMCGVHIEWEYQTSREQIRGHESWWKIRHKGLVELSGKMFLHGFPAAVCNKIFRRDFLLKYHIQFPKGLKQEDYYFHNVCVAHASHMVFVQEKLYHYRQRQGSIDYDIYHNKPFASTDRMRIAMLLWEYYKKHNLLGKWNGYIAERWIECLKASLRRERSKKARKLITRIARDFISDDDKHTHALSVAQRGEIVRVINDTCSNLAVYGIKYRAKKICINLIPVAAWRRRLRRKYLPVQ